MTGRKEKQMITSKYEWQFAAPFSDDTFLAQAKKRGLEASAAKLLGERGIQTEEALDRFLEPRLEDLHDPHLLQGFLHNRSGRHPVRIIVSIN